jgi:hypothetical protein
MKTGCGQACVVTSEWANEAEGYLRQNIGQYFGLSVRTRSDQQSALNIFDAIWNGLVQRCSQPGLSTAGKNCIADREGGACKWHATADSPWPGGPVLGACWNWRNAYRDPIANDAGVVSDAAGAVGTVASFFSSSGASSSWVPWALAGVLLLGVVL